MSKRIRQGLVWGGVVVLVGGFIALDIVRRPEGIQPGEIIQVDAVSAATKPGQSVVGVIRSDYERLKEPAPPDAELTVAQVEAMVRYAVAMAGGLHTIIEPGTDWVVIKPNIVELKTQGSGVITDWRIVRALIKMVQQVAPDARVTIAEGSGEWIPPGSPPNEAMAVVGDGFEVAGYRQLLNDPEFSDVDLDIVDLNFDEAVETPVPDGGNCMESYYVPLTILECDVLIDVPVLKVIGGVGMTVAMKNLIGIAPGMKYGWAKSSGYPPGSGNPGLPHFPSTLDELIVDLTAIAEVDFTVVDAITGMERAKTDRWGGLPVRMNTIVASADIVAADAVAAAVMGFNPDDIEYVTLASWRGLGTGDLSQIKVNGQPIEQVRRRFEKNTGGPGEQFSRYGQGNRTWLLKGPFERKRGEASVEEFIDVQHPDVLPGQNGWSQPVYFYDDKIDLDGYYDDPSDCAVYAYATFTVPKEQDAELWVGSDEGLRVWINGERVYDYRGARRHRLPNDRERIHLRAGEHTVLVRADQTRGRFDFSLNICEPEEDPRYDGNRVWGLKFAVPEGETWAELRPPTRGREVPKGAKMLKEAAFARHFDALMGSLEGCVRFLGEERSTAYLMGVTGHAFRISVADSLGLDGPMRVDLPRMLNLYRSLGYELRLISAREGDPDFRTKQQEAWDTIRASIDRRVPAVARFGPFFWIIRGYHPKKERYYTSAFMPSLEAPVEMDELGLDGGLGDWNMLQGSAGLEVLIWGEQQAVDPKVAERRSLRFAVDHARSEDDLEGRVHRGFGAFERWMTDVVEGRVSKGVGPAYTAAVVTEARGYAGLYLNGIAEHYPEQVAARLREAAYFYGMEVERLKNVTEAFPLMSRQEQVDLGDPEGRQQVAGSLREALEWERKAVKALEEALAMMP